MTNEKNIRNRIEEAMNQKGLNPRSISGEDVNFYQKCFLQLAKGKTITLPVIAALFEKMPDLSAEWLFRGVGEPFEKVVVENTPAWADAMEKRLLSAITNGEKKVCQDNNSDDSEGTVKVKVELK